VSRARRGDFRRELPKRKESKTKKKKFEPVLLSRGVNEREKESFGTGGGDTREDTQAGGVWTFGGRRKRKEGSLEKKEKAVCLI